MGFMEAFGPQLGSHGFFSCSVGLKKGLVAAAERVGDASGINIGEKVGERILRIGSAADVFGFLSRCHGLRQKRCVPCFMQAADSVLHRCQVT